MGIRGMAITGNQLINGDWEIGRAGSSHAIHPLSGQPLEPPMSMADLAQVKSAIHAAHIAAEEYASTSLQTRSGFLRAITTQMEALKTDIVTRYCLETGYSEARATQEFLRTTHQLTMFSDYILSGEHLNVRIDFAEPNRHPTPKPDLRSMNIALGPVAVFGAANFPLAYSVAGGDTASALAAGCPVLVKSHPSHPGVCELVAQAINTARQQLHLPKGVFSLLHGAEETVGATLASAPEIQAIGFTGSFRGGMALHKISAARPTPIPVFAEMGSINPVIVLPQALQQRTLDIARGYVQSLTLHSGQYCVNPGILVVLKTPELEPFIKALRTELQSIDADVMLNARIHLSYLDRIESLTRAAKLIASGKPVSHKTGYFSQAHIMEISGAEFIANKELQQETFGPAGLLVTCANESELTAITNQFTGQLTATVHASDQELVQLTAMLTSLSRRVGRLIINGFPTGVEVGCATVHGGPFPATTDSRFTSVGTDAIMRFLRPICFQNHPEYLLPPELKLDNPLGIFRRENGKFIHNQKN